jgi:flagellar biosynthesis protein FlhF
MRIKKYTAKSMKEALLQIKQELGEDAIILKTSHMHGKLFSQGDIEVTAAIDEEARKDASVSHQAFAPLRVSDTGVYKRPKPAPEMPVAQEAKKDDTPERRRQMPASNGTLEKKYETIQADISELKALFTSYIKPGETIPASDFSGDWALLYKKLVEAEVPQDIAHRFIARICSDKQTSAGDVVQRFIGELNTCFVADDQPAAGQEKKPRVIMFVGPTGAGKTTTLAKLAAQQVLAKSKSVSVITADTYRIAAIEQIRTFTEIMNVDLHIVFSPKEADEALVACASQDIVFIDTAGRSQKSSEHMGELSVFIKHLMPHEVHLVLSAGTKVSDLLITIEKYRQLGVNRLLFTKLDETMKLGNVFGAGIQSKIPFSFFTFGQRVPDDIERAQPHRLVQRLFEGGGL